jgi:hypothetical protein
MFVTPCTLAKLMTSKPWAASSLKYALQSGAGFTDAAGSNVCSSKLKQEQEPPGTKSPVEILTLKPTVYGVGIDLKELARRVPLLACASARRATMSLLVLVIAPPRVPALAAGEGVGMRYLEFFAANIRTRTHAGPMPAPPMNSWPGARASAFRRSVPCNRSTSPPGSRLGRARLAAPSNQRLAAIRHLLIGLVTGQVVPVNPAASVRGPRHVVTSGQTPLLNPSEARALLDSTSSSGCATAR